MPPPSPLWATLVILLTLGVVHLPVVDAIAQDLKRPQINSLAETFNGILFGPLWRYDEYCGLYRPDEQILEEDHQIRTLYNGSAIESIDFSSRKVELFEELDALNYVGIKSRHSLLIICSVSSWGYSSDSIEKLSNEPFQDCGTCLRQMDRFHHFVKSLELDKQNSVGIEQDSPLNSIQRPSQLSLVAENDELRKYWLQLNSFGRVPSGQLPFRHVWVGDYDECLRLAETRYCIGSYANPKFASKSKHSEGYRVGLCLPRACSKTILLNSPDHLDKLDSIIKYNLVDLPFGFRDKNRYRLIDLHCEPQVESPLRNLVQDRVSAFLLIMPFLWLTFLIYSTWQCSSNKLGADNNISVESNQILDCFDMKQIWDRFTNLRHTSEDFVGLNGIKTVTMTWFIVTHIYFAYNPIVENYTDIRDRWSPFAAFLLQGQHAVPIFYILSGLLAGYKFLYKKIDFLPAITHRYFRLMPMYLIVYAYVKKFSHLLGSGPLWDYGVSPQSEANQCIQESWLVPVLMLANTMAPASHCLIPGWHIANDFQIFLCMPLLFAAYRRSRKLGTLTVIGVFFLTHLSHSIYWGNSNKYDFDDFSAEPFLLGGVVVVGRLAMDYTNPFGRLGTYMLGVLLADLLFHRNRREANSDKQLDGHSKADAAEEIPMQPKGDNSTKVNKSGQENAPLSGCSYSFRDLLILGFGWFLVLFTIASPLLPDSIRHAYDPHSKALAYPFCRFNIEIGWAILIYYFFRRQSRASPQPCKHMTDQEITAAPTVTSAADKPISSGNSASSSRVDINFWLKFPFWNLLTKLSYTVLMTHTTIARIIGLSIRELPKFSWYAFFQFSLFVILTSHLVCIILHLTIEVPLIGLTRILFRKLFAEQLETAADESNNTKAPAANLISGNQLSG